MDLQRLTIDFDPESGSIKVTGPIDKTFWCVGALEEAKRFVQRRANKRQDARENGGSGHSGLVVAPAGTLPGT